MDASLLLNVVSTVTVVGGVLFAALQVTEMRRARDHDSALSAVHSYETPEFARALRIALDPRVPDGLSLADLEARLSDGIDCVWLLMTTWESLGILVHGRNLPLQAVDDFFSGPLIISWRKYQQVVIDLRAQMKRDTYFEWFQWLAEQMAERERSAAPVPAHIAHKNWRP
jgi:hypothetical protein